MNLFSPNTLKAFYRSECYVILKTVMQSKQWTEFKNLNFVETFVIQYFKVPWSCQGEVEQAHLKKSNQVVAPRHACSNA